MALPASARTLAWRLRRAAPSLKFAVVGDHHKEGINAAFAPATKPSRMQITKLATCGRGRGRGEGSDHGEIEIQRGPSGTRERWARAKSRTADVGGTAIWVASDSLVKHDRRPEKQ